MQEVTIDEDKLTQLTETETWTDKKTGEKKSKRVIKFQLKELRDEKKQNRFSNDNVSIVKSHYAMKKQTKDEREAKADPIFCGDGVTFTFTESGQREKPAPKPINESQEEQDDLPFQH